MQLHRENTLRQHTVDTEKTAAVPKQLLCVMRTHVLLSAIKVATISAVDGRYSHRRRRGGGGTRRERLRVTGFVWTLHTSFISIFNILLLKIVVSTDMESRQSNKESAI